MYPIIKFLWSLLIYYNYLVAFSFIVKGIDDEQDYSILIEHTVQNPKAQALF